MTEPTVLIKYIGDKPIKKDTVCGTSTLWAGNGDVQPFPRNKSALLLRHKFVWCAASEQEAAGNGYGPAIGIASVDKPPLQAEASVHDEENDAPPNERRAVGQPTLTSEPVKEIGHEENDPELMNFPQTEHEVLAEAPEEKPVVPEAKPQNRKADLVTLIRSMPKDAEHFSPTTGKPIVAKVRELAGDESIAAVHVKKAWRQVSGGR
ncbi:hypothetical protein [Microbulbifer sp. GL-2]|uniref:hypothetical protein n=1 Tax=Microbulbifer sp. GL-2 TaxID=2591606 RepID=UPI0011641898|nr:hypothetical protein [Microbulbifer sp. GL-2]BBM03777.1 hypothetical protein GL2_38510 [Microbulbifer sp. GL-2]